MSRYYRRIDDMKWVEIITLRSPGKINRQLVDELVKGVRESGFPTGTQKHLVEIRIYHHSVVETDLSIHIYWKSEPVGHDKSPLGLRFSSALRNLGLLSHSVWVQTIAVEFPPQGGDARSRDRVASVGSTARNGRRGG
ncbi:MAG: hypothetical protein ABSG75_02650 [Syntrophales bacterium]